MARETDVSFAIEEADSALNIGGIISQGDLSYELGERWVRMPIVKALITDARERVDNEEVQTWLKELEVVVGKAQDLLEKISDDNMRLSELVEKVCSPFPMISRKILLMNIAPKFKEVRGDLYEVLGKKPQGLEVALDEVIGKKAQGLEERRDKTTVKISSDLPKEEKKMIGREFDMIKVILRLLKSPPEAEGSVSVFSIVGERGVGKTVLAQCVFNDVNVKYHFDLRTWISVSEVFDLKQIVCRIIESATGGQSLENSDIEQLVGNLRKNIEGKRYLLVLDNVRNEKWLQLLQYLGGSAKGSQILVTTRSEPGLAQVTDSRKTYHLKGLDDSQSRSLFNRFASEHGGEPESNFIRIREEILQKCGGNPLVIKTIGSILRFKRTEAEWSSFVKRHFSGTPQIKDPMKDPKKDPILGLLELYYENLPWHLKYCFAYCAIFPEQYEIDVKTLISLWIAQRFVIMSSKSYTKNGKGKTESMEDVGYSYFCELHSREFFEAIERDENDRVTKCKIPNYDLVVSVAGERYIMSKLNEDKIRNNSCHLSFHFHLEAPWQVPTSLDLAKRIQTILLPSQLRWETQGRPRKCICDKIVSSCKFLHVLDLHNSGVMTVSGSIRKLKHLRYLDLSHNMDIRSLPDSITKLRNLHTLKLNFCSRLEGLPRDTRNLVKLRHLEIEGCYSFSEMPLGLGQLTNLRTLSVFVLSKDSSTKRSCGLDELMNLNNLQGQLLIKNLKRGKDYKVANLKEKKFLRSLGLIWDVVSVAAMRVADRHQGNNCSSNEGQIADDYFESLAGLEPHTNIKELSVSAYGGNRFPDWFASLKNLVTVSLWRCMNCQYLPPLDQFSGLKILVLGQLTSLEYIADEVNFNSSSSVAVLSSLKELRLIELPKLKGWWREKVGREEDHDGPFSATTTIKTAPTAENQPPSFSILSKLVIENCPELNSIPLFPCLDELLELNNSSWKPFQQTIMTSNTAFGSAASTSVPTASVSPFSKLRCLRIVGIKEVDMNNGDAIKWSLFNKNLRSLTFDHLPQLEDLPEGLKDIVNLRELHISRCYNFKTVPEWITELNSLKKVSLRLLPNLNSLPKGMNIRTPPIMFEIEDCPKVARNPYPIQDLVNNYVKTSEDDAKANAGEVVLNGSIYSWEQFEEAVAKISSNPPSRAPTSDTGGRESRPQPGQPSNDESSKNRDASSNPKVEVSRVVNLHIVGVRNSASLPEWLEGLTCLKKLSIGNCPDLKHLSPPRIDDGIHDGIHHVTSLQELYIYKCEKLDMGDNDATEWAELQRLRHITFQELPKLKRLPKGLVKLTALRKLHVLDCRSLETIPELEIHDLKSLKEIRILNCPNLTSLPEGISKLASLCELEIVGCPILLNGCQRGGGEWKKIAHVPKLYLGSRIIHRPFLAQEVGGCGVPCCSFDNGAGVPFHSG